MKKHIVIPACSLLLLFNSQCYGAAHEKTPAEVAWEKETQTREGIQGLRVLLKAQNKNIEAARYFTKAFDPNAARYELTIPWDDMKALAEATQDLWDKHNELKQEVKKLQNLHPNEPLPKPQKSTLGKLLMGANHALHQHFQPDGAEEAKQKPEKD